MGDNLSPADYAAINGNNNGFGGDGGWAWLIIILAMFSGGFGFGGFGGGFGGFGMGMDFMYPWLANGQQEIMQNTNQGFDTLHLSNQIEGVRDGVYGLSNQLCNCCADMQQTVSNGFYNAEISANNRQMADMQQNFALSTQLANASADNRLGIANLNSTILAENCADREALREVGQSIIVNQNNNTQKIIDEIFRDRLDEKDSKISDLQRELQMADLRASQIAQTQAITSNIYNELKNCPIRNSSGLWKSTDFHLQWK